MYQFECDDPVEQIKYVYVLPLNCVTFFKFFMKLSAFAELARFITVSYNYFFCG